MVMKLVTHHEKYIYIKDHQYYTFLPCCETKPSTRAALCILTASFFGKWNGNKLMNWVSLYMYVGNLLFNEPFCCHDSSKNAPCHEDRYRIRFYDRFHAVEQLLMFVWCHRRCHRHFGQSLKMYYYHYYLCCYCDDYYCCCYCYRHRLSCCCYCWAA